MDSPLLIREPTSWVLCPQCPPWHPEKLPVDTVEDWPKMANTGQPFGTVKCFRCGFESPVTMTVT